jgi:hypothetical protein
VTCVVGVPWLSPSAQHYATHKSSNFDRQEAMNTKEAKENRSAQKTAIMVEQVEPIGTLTDGVEGSQKIIVTMKTETVSIQARPSLSKVEFERVSQPMIHMGQCRMEVMTETIKGRNHVWLAEPVVLKRASQLPSPNLVRMRTNHGKLMMILQS